MNTQTETSEYKITLNPRGPNSCEWKVWHVSGGLPKAMGVHHTFAGANLAAKKAKEKLEAKKGA